MANIKISADRLQQMAYNPMMCNLTEEAISALRELSELRIAADAIAKDLDELLNLFCDSSKFYIKKLGSPIAEEDQNLIDDTFVHAQDSLIEYKKVVQTYREG